MRRNVCINRQKYCVIKQKMSIFELDRVAFLRKIFVFCESLAVLRRSFILPRKCLCHFSTDLRDFVKVSCYCAYTCVNHQK